MGNCFPQRRIETNSLGLPEDLDQERELDLHVEHRYDEAMSYDVI